MPQLFKDITLFFTLCPHPAPWSGGEEPAAGCQFKACAEMHPPSIVQILIVNGKG
jgi:hypothetical protein